MTQIKRRSTKVELAGAKRRDDSFEAFTTTRPAMAATEAAPDKGDAGLADRQASGAASAFRIASIRQVPHSQSVVAMTNPGETTHPSEHDPDVAASYTRQRDQPSELSFRYQNRADTAVAMMKKYGTPAGQEPRALLDIGAADGRTLQRMAGGLSLTEGLGIEYSQALLDQARDIQPPLQLLHADATNLHQEIPEPRFDAVTALAVLEHLPEPVQAVAEAARVLKPGGLFLASCPDPFWDRISSGVLGVKAHDYEVGGAFLKQLVADVPALELVAYHKFMFVPVAVLPYLKLHPSSTFARRIDSLIEPLRIFKLLFANQMLVARKTAA